MVLLYFVSVVAIFLFCLLPNESKMLFSSSPLLLALALFLDEIFPHMLNRAGYKKTAGAVMSFMLLVMIFLPLFTVDSAFWPFKFFVPLGALFNLIAIAGNGWRMPDAALSLDGNYNEYTHTPVNESTRFTFFIDRIEHWSLGGYTASIGDVLIFAGTIIATIQIGLLYVIWAHL